MVRRTQSSSLFGGISIRGVGLGISSNFTASLGVMTVPAMNVQRLLVEAEIREVLFRYCRGIDRLDEELVRSCYHPDAIDSHGNFEGDVDEFVMWAFGLLRRYSITMHFLGNI